MIIENLGKTFSSVFNFLSMQEKAEQVGHETEAQSAVFNRNQFENLSQSALQLNLNVVKKFDATESSLQEATRKIQSSIAA